MENYETEETEEKVKVLLLSDLEDDKRSLINNYSNWSDLILNDLNSQSPKKKIKFFLWNTANYMISAVPINFFNHAKVIIFIYGITKKATFNSIKEKWYPFAEKYWENDHILAVVGYKQELYGNAEVRKDEGDKYAKEIRAFFYEVNSLDGGELHSLFTDIGRACLSKKKEEKEKKHGNYGILRNCSCSCSCF